MNKSMLSKYPYLRQIKPEELADFLNAKGSTQDNFKCPICGNIHQSLIDNMPISEENSEAKIVLQPVLPAFTYPNGVILKLAIENNELHKNYEQFTNGSALGFVNQVTYREVIHLICENCGYVRTFSKNKVLDWLVKEGRFDEQA
nr:MAG TPA: nucleic-acid-binding protein [Bacteriophage sp.]